MNDEIEEDAIDPETAWPITRDVPCAELAAKIAEFCAELAGREVESRERSLKAALAIWPSLKKALAAAGRKLMFEHSGEPILPEWAHEPVVGVQGIPGTFKCKTKAEAMRLALTGGDGRFATIGELWLWVAGGGPIVDRTLAKFGYAKGYTPNRTWGL